MNRMSLLLVVMMVFTLGAAPMKAGTNEVVLNASQVSSALDIESAIDAATHDGTQPGIVTLDSSQGDFVYSDWRRSIEVSVSNITIRSRNGAVFPNCDNGILFPSSADGVTIEGLTFHCRGVGIGGGNEHSHVTIRDNTFVVGNYGIYADHAADWQIVGNYIESLGPEPGILIENSNDIEVSKNQLIMHPQFNVHQGVILDHTNNSTVSNNKITATGYGIIIENTASHNRIAHNSITGTQLAGVYLGWQVAYNKVQANRVECAVGFACEAVRVSPEAGAKNKITGSKLTTSETPGSFTTTVMPGVWSTFPLGAASEGSVYIADVTPLHASVGGAYVPFMIVPQYDGNQWDDVLRLTVPAGASSEEVQVRIYKLSGRPTIMDETDALAGGFQQTYPIAASMAYFPAPYLADVDPQAASIAGMTLEDILIAPEFLSGEWMDVLRIETTTALYPDRLPVRMRVYTADQLYIVYDSNVTLTRNDTWIGFAIDRSALERGYIVRFYPLDGDTRSTIDYYRIQPEFDGADWYDVLRIRMGNLDQDWEPTEYNIKIYACDPVICP